jgi:hypothetical protein
MGNRGPFPNLPLGTSRLYTTTIGPAVALHNNTTNGYIFSGSDNMSSLAVSANEGPILGALHAASTALYIALASAGVAPPFHFPSTTTDVAPAPEPLR